MSKKTFWAIAIIGFILTLGIDFGIVNLAVYLENETMFKVGMSLTGIYKVIYLISCVYLYNYLFNREENSEQQEDEKA